MKKVKGLWIDDRIWDTGGLTITDKCLLAKISSLEQAGMCYANNQFFADFLTLSKQRVSQIISKLAENGYIKCYFDYILGTSKTDRRVMEINWSKFK